MRRLVPLALMFSVAGCVEQSADAPSEDDVKAAREHVLSAAPTMKYPANAALEDKLVYLGMDVDVDKVVPGKAFTLTHYWKVEKAVPEGWKLFVHLEAPDSKKSHLNADHVPINGKYPINIWKPGEIIRDIHRVSVPQNWPADALEIYVGLWKGPIRMKVTSGPHDAENRVLAVKLPISKDKDQPAEQKRLVARKVKPGTIKVDGKLDEAAWKDAPFTTDFVRSLDGAAVAEKANAKVLWDDKNLYVAFNVEDKDVWSTLDKHDDKLWNQEAVEMFIDADGDGKTYVELQVNPKNATFDAWLPAYRKNENDWTSKMKTAVHVDGTLDNRNDIDKGWTVEMAIPLEDAKGKLAEMKNVPPKVGTEWRVNFFRLDMPAGRPQQGSAWSPPMVGDFHALDRFGVLVFGDEKGQAPKLAASKPASAPAPSATPATPTPATGEKKAQPEKASIDGEKKAEAPRKIVHLPPE
jgi:hypothetical protein